MIIKKDLSNVFINLFKLKHVDNVGNLVSDIISWKHILFFMHASVITEIKEI